MLTSIPCLPSPLPVAFPPLLPGPPPVPPFEPGIPFAEPPGTPACLPSGEMETRAARLPRGGTTGAGGAGAAEIAMNIAGFPFARLGCAVPTSGAGPASPVCACCAIRGAAPAFNSSFGRAGPLDVTGSAISPGFCSNAGTSGSGAAVTVAGRRSRGRNFESICWSICSRGRAGPGNGCICTMFGRFGRIFGGSIGAAELISVWRGCVG